MVAKCTSDLVCKNACGGYNVISKDSGYASVILRFEKFAKYFNPMGLKLFQSILRIPLNCNIDFVVNTFYRYYVVILN